MAKFLDKTGLDTFWTKIKSTFQPVADRVTSIRAASSATDTNYPTEKAVRTELDNKAQTYTIKQTDAYKCFLCITDLTQLYDSTGQQPISQRFNMVGQWSTWRNGTGYESTSVFFMKYHLAYRWNLNSADCFDLRSTIPSGGTAYPAILRDARDPNNVKFYFGLKLNTAWATAFQFVGRLNDIEFNSLVWIDGVGSGGTGQGTNLPDGCELIATPKVLDWTVEHSSTADNVTTTEVACGASDKVVIADYSDGWKLKRLNASLGTVNGANAWAFGASSLCGPRSGIDATPYVQWDFMDGQAFSIGGETYYAYTADPNTTVSVSYNGETVSVSVPSGNNRYTIFVITDAAYLGSASFAGRDRCTISIDGKTSYRVSIANNYSVTGGYVVAVNIGNNAWGHATSSSRLLAAKAVASNSFSGNNSHTMGYFSAASGNQSVASGNLSVASGNYSIASGRNSIAAGHSSIASGDFSVTTAQYANAVGAYSVAKNESAQVLARGGLSGRSYQTVLGRWNEEKSDRVLVIGEGTSSVSRKNILEVDADGEMYLTSQKKKAYREGLTVPVSDGGTGKTSVTSGNYVVGAGTSSMVEKIPKDVGSDVLSSLDDKSNASSYADFVDGDFVVGSDHVNASTISASTFVRRTALNLWNYIKSKLSGSDVNIGGNAATATKATQDSDGSAINTTYKKLAESSKFTEPQWIDHKESPSYCDLRIGNSSKLLSVGVSGSGNIWIKEIADQRTNSPPADKSIIYTTNGNSVYQFNGNAATATALADDSNYVHKTGNETVGGKKTFTDAEVNSESSSGTYSGFFVKRTAVDDGDKVYRVSLEVNDDGSRGIYDYGGSGLNGDNKWILRKLPDGSIAIGESTNINKISIGGITLDFSGSLGNAANTLYFGWAGGGSS